MSPSSTSSPTASGSRERRVKEWDNQSVWRDIAGTYAAVTRTAEGKTFDLLQLTSGAESRYRASFDEPVTSCETTTRAPTSKSTSACPTDGRGAFGLTLSEAEGRQASSLARERRQRRMAMSTAGDFGRPNPNDIANSEGLLIWDRPVLLEGQIVSNSAGP